MAQWNSIMIIDNVCPFRVEQLVIYQPSRHGHGQIIMSDLSNLVPGNKYRIKSIVKETYLIVEGFENSPTGGLHWTEFAA